MWSEFLSPIKSIRHKNGNKDRGQLACVYRKVTPSISPIYSDNSSSFWSTPHSDKTSINTPPKSAINGFNNSTRNPNIFSKQNQTSSEEIVISDEDDRLNSSTNTLVTINDCLLDDYPDLLDDDEDDSSGDEETN